MTGLYRPVIFIWTRLQVGAHKGEQVSSCSLFVFNLAGRLTAVLAKRSLPADLESFREQAAAVTMSQAVPGTLDDDESLP